ncbi:CHAT domain-containing protein [Kitasatospora sp. NPDC004615]|uniref:CHAT domain-containing protein n=1 Tax=Kitasatospora sp. NPDC004615 TaxID=3364017 RepID=UPI0036BB65F0
MSTHQAKPRGASADIPPSSEPDRVTMTVGHHGGAMRDALVEDLDARIAEYVYQSETEALLDEAGRDAAMRLMALVAEEVQGSHHVDTEALYTAAAFHWARAVALGDDDRAQVEHEMAIHLFGLLFLADHRKVPRELWPKLVQETGHDPWADPLEHAADLVVDFEQQQDWAALDEALGLLQRVPRGGDGAYQDTLLGLAHQYRAMAPARDDQSRLADADRAVELLSAVAALPESSASRTASRLLTLGSAQVGHFELTGHQADLADAARSYRRALELAAPGSPEQVSAMIGVGTGFGRQAEAPGIEQSDLVAQLREAVDWLRRAADLDLQHGRRSDRANLAKATGLLLEHTLRLRRACDVGTDQGTQDASAPAAPPTEAEAAQARRLIALGDEVDQRIVTEQEALRQVGKSGSELSETAVRIVVRVAVDLVRIGTPRRAVAVLALTLAAAERHWGTDRDGPWWWVADTYVEAARLALAEQPNGVLFQHAREVAGRQIDVLRGRDAVQDTAELAETLFVDGLLCLTPYTGGLVDLSFASAQQLRRDREARYMGVHTGRWEGVTMPDPRYAVEEAVARLREAAAFATGHQRGRTLKALVEALSMLAGLTGTSHDQEARAAAREAVGTLDPFRDPLGYLYLLRILALLGELFLPRELDGLLPVPLDEVRERQGEHEAASLFTEALALAAETGHRDLEAALIEAADGAGLRLRKPDQQRVRWASEVHLLHEDTLDCPVPGGVRAATEELTTDPPRKPAERAAALVHLAAHCGEDDEQSLGRTLLLEAVRSAPDWVDQHVEMVTHLYGRLSYDLAVHADRAGDWAMAAECFAVAGAQYTMADQEDLALYAFEAGLACVRDCDHPEASIAAAALLGSMTSLRASTDEGVAWKLRELYLSLGALLSAHARVDATTVFLLHQVAKGMDFSIAVERSGPFTPSRALAAAIDQASLDAAQPPPAEGTLSPDDAILCYVGTGEAEPESGPDARQRNLQRAVDRRISMELHLTRNLPRNALLGLGEVQTLLPEDTVLLSLFLGQFPGPNGTDLRTGTVGLAVTREEVRLRTVAFNDVGGDLLRLTRGLHTMLIHPVASPVSVLRQAVTADPLHRLVSREAGTALEYAGTQCLAGFGELMGHWQVEGKRHLCIWPNGPLHFVPYPLLPVADGLVADDWTVTQLSSLASLRATTAELTPPTARHELVAFGSATGGVRHGLVAETALEHHASSVAASMGGRAVLGAAATPSRFLRELGTSRYVHVAAHGAHNEWASWYQCLFLSPDFDNDGRVFAHDILRTDLRGVELVTMSSCESALGRYDVNDNLRGLPAAFLAAGASAVIGCLWPVHPDVATDFFAKLYRQLCGNGDRRSAFRSAQCHTRTKHPAYRDWGSFCFIGDWRAPHTPRGVAQ